MSLGFEHPGNLPSYSRARGPETGRRAPRGSCSYAVGGEAAAALPIAAVPAGPTRASVSCPLAAAEPGDRGAGVRGRGEHLDVNGTVDDDPGRGRAAPLGELGLKGRNPKAPEAIRRSSAKLDEEVTVSC